MATEGWGNSGPVARELIDRPESFEFFQAVRLARMIWAGRADVGSEADPAEEVVRFRSDVNLCFPRSDLVSFEPPSDTRPMALACVAFMGAATPASFGSLPSRYATEIHDLAREGNDAFRDFLDLFNHRFVSLFYRAWEKYRFAIRFEHDERGLFEDAVFALIGMGTPGLRGRLPIGDHALLYRAGLLALAPVPAVALRSLIESYFGVPARVMQFEARWYPLDPEDQTSLGRINASLGQDAVVGSSVRLCQHRFRLALGPLDWDTYERHLPAGNAYPATGELVRFAVSEELEFDVQLVLRKEDVPPATLGEGGPRRVRLGWTTWIGSGSAKVDRGDAIFPIERAPEPEALESLFETLPAMEARP
jgi:type VI secretion system protein ImpH